jgi:hypothetical protein
MNYYVATLAGTETGGVQLGYQMAYELVQNGMPAKMMVANEYGLEDTCAKSYLKYGIPNVKQFSDVSSENSVVIISEIMSVLLPELKEFKKVFWWMSVDGYVERTNESNFDEISESVDLHLVQSYYAYDYLTRKHGIPESKVMFVTDYIDEVFGQFILPPQYRKDIALYNPKKGYEDLKPLIEMTPWLEWIPLCKLTAEEVAVLMETAKVYVDFGSHPGKDRIPREAASCGCCVVTNRKGSAAFEQDVPIPDKYKFSDVHSQYADVELLLKDICVNYGEHVKQFENYRQSIKAEKARFSSEVKKFIEVCEGWK